MYRRSSFRRRAPTLALLGALVAGCGSEPAEPDAATDAAPSSQPSRQAPGEATEEVADASTVTSISMRRTGGIRGVHDEWRLSPGDEFSDRAFELAARRGPLEAEAAELKDELRCCDFFVYDLNVRYADGSSLQAVLDESSQDMLLWDLVTAVSDTSREEPDEPLE